MGVYNLFDVPLSNAIGAPRHDSHFRNPEVLAGIIDMAEYIQENGLKAYLEREYPDTSQKSIIVNIIHAKMYIVDGNRHLVSMLTAMPGLTVHQLNEIHPGVVRIWRAGIELGKNDEDSRYQVYIPAEVDISRIPGAHLGMDYFKNPPAPTNIIPGDFPVDSELLNPEDRGVLIADTLSWVRPSAL